MTEAKAAAFRSRDDADSDGLLARAVNGAAAPMRQPGLADDGGNPRILHRIYFDNFPPYRDPFERFEQTWIEQMPDYRIMRWNADNLDLDACDYVRRAVGAAAPVFLSEYFRWRVLSEHGGIYLDADCQVIDGAKLHALAEDLFASRDYDAAVGVEEHDQGFPTAQTVIARKDAALVRFMRDIYETQLGGPLWHWREIRGLIGPQLISLYFWENGSFLDSKGMPVRLEEPVVESRVKVYTQDYFSPKFTIDGRTLRESPETCVYHLFANLNIEFPQAEQTALRERPLLFDEYKQRLHPLRTIHRIYFGFDGKPDRFGDYLAGWAEQMPGYRIKRWDATNLPMDLNEYVVRLHAERDHAFLSDYFRWWLLREYGGIYLDADVEIVDGAHFDQLVADLEGATAFDAAIGIDNRGGGWYTAHSMMARRGAEITRFMCDVYERMGPLVSWRKKAFYLWAPQLTALYFAAKGHHPDGMGTTPHLAYPEVHGRVKIYPQDYFSPLTPEPEGDRLFKLNAYSERTVLCHHFACSWHGPDSPYAAHAAERIARTTLLRDLVAADPRSRRLLTQEWTGEAAMPPEPDGFDGDEPDRDGVSGAGDDTGAAEPDHDRTRAVVQASLPALPALPRSFKPPGLRERIALGLGDDVRFRRAITLADEARDSGAYEAAALYFAEALSFAPERHDLWVQLGNMFKDAGKFASAEFAYRRALSVRPTDHETFLQLGHLRVRQGDEQTALAFYERALTLAPDCGPAAEALHRLA